ncbi:MAG: T9SS type A sorting domain-containing protein [bacterium]
MRKWIAAIFLFYAIIMPYCVFGANTNGINEGFESQDISDWAKFPSALELGVSLYSPGYMSDYCVKISGDGLKPPAEEGYISSLPWINSGYLSIEKPSDWEQGSVYTLRCMIRTDRASLSGNGASSKAYLECDDPDGDIILSKSLFVPPSEWTECILNGYINNSPITTIKLGYETGQGAVYFDDVSFHNSSCYLQSNTPLVFYVHDADDIPLSVTINRLQGATASTILPEGLPPVVSVFDPFGNLKLTKTCEPGNQSFVLTIPPDNIRGDYRIEIPQDISSFWQVSAKNLIFEGRQVSVNSRVDSVVYFAVNDRATFTLRLMDEGSDAGTYSATLYNPNGLAVKKITWQAVSGEQHELIMDSPATGGVWAVGFGESSSGEESSSDTIHGNISISTEGIPPYFSFTKDSYFLPTAWRYPSENFSVIANQAKKITSRDEKIILSIPARGISQNGTISIRKMDAPVIPSGYFLASQVYNIEARGTSSSLVPLQPIPLTFHYDDASLSEKTEKTLAVFYYGTSTSSTNTATWIPLPTISRSIKDNFISVNVSRFAPFAILSSPAWQVRLSVETSERTMDSGNYFGMDPGAQNTYTDPFDLEEEPSAPKPCISLYVTSPNGTRFTKDIRALRDLSIGVEEWAFDINTDVLLRAGAQVTITWDISSIPSNYPINLLEINQQLVNLREIKSYGFIAPTGNNTRRFILQVGGEKEGTITVSRTFSNNWNLCSIPLLLANPEPDAVFSRGRISKFLDGKYIAYEQEEGFGTITPGVGYWFKTNSTITISFVGHALGNGTYSIPVRSGWNLIGNPFIFGVGWNNILFSYGTITEKVSDGRIIKDGIYRYGTDQNNKTGYSMDRYRDNPVMKPWEGYWLYSSMAGNLKIPAISSQPLAALAPELLQNQKNWEIKLSAFTDKSTDQDNYFGVAEDASDGYNKYCLFEPPNGYPPYVSLYFPVNDRDVSGNFACAYKSQLSNSPKVWDFEVLTDGMQNTDVTLQWKEMTVPEVLTHGCNLCLTDLTTDAKIDMCQTDSYTYHNGTERIRRFQITAVATVNETLTANNQIYVWPNPLTVNGMSPDKFTFANRSNSVIRIYTLAGELVATINKDTWDAKNDDGKAVASGVYFYVVEDGGNVRKTGKLAVIR